ncbi:DinB family protein [Flavobacterium aquatile]|uniref:Damage-inducible protein DinB n=1 Tax=Flavobacterium aquatile LMG 4008 = ATCC 11947 TaxID=1453498 RepID=A0A095SQA8_9FLAO|nr:DinB family protein [Flavobacterium aquatile]KGD66752.1 hypothetical protein LG45_15045 [Flavobacterium aquatile LMG 4008 = ATCC 11947]OXA67849.1 hypothetical protein B0A61_05085 [Flavobacterium aquatile LMG 4008 = ATCC 11947]GEC78746.1 hypothetical protein FAQ01_16160 [Flavobacterium aquatile]
MQYKPGAIGALTDEYQKALNELKAVLETIPNELFLKTDFHLDLDFQSIRNITNHIVHSGYTYSNYARTSFGTEKTNPFIEINSVKEAIEELDKMFLYKVKTFEDKWLMSDDEMMSTIIKTSWTTYDLEALLEHSIVHILRHRLQIQKRITLHN